MNNNSSAVIILVSLLISCSSSSSIVYLDGAANSSSDISSGSSLDRPQTDAITSASKINSDHGELNGLYLTTDRTQMTGVARDSVTLSVNESITVYVRGMDDKGKWFMLSDGIAVTWKADRELEVSPASGTEVRIKILSKAPVSYATVTVITKEGRKLKEEFAVQIK